MGKKLVIVDGLKNRDYTLNTVVIGDYQTQFRENKIVFEGRPEKPLKEQRRSNGTKKIFQVEEYILLSLHKSEDGIKRVIVSIHSKEAKETLIIEECKVYQREDKLILKGAPKNPIGVSKEVSITFHKSPNQIEKIAIALSPSPFSIFFKESFDSSIFY